MDASVGEVVSWVSGLFLILVSVGIVLVFAPAILADAGDFTHQPVLIVSSFSIYLVTGVFLIPDARQKIEKRGGLSFSRRAVVIIAIVGIAAGTVSGMRYVDTYEVWVSHGEPVLRDPPSTPDRPLSVPRTTQTLGEEFDIRNVTYRIERAATRQQAGDEAVGVEADGKFLVLNMSVVNGADEPVTIQQPSIEDIGQSNNRYRPSTEASAALENSFRFGELNSGGQSTGQIAYDVNERSTRLPMRVVVRPAKRFSAAEPEYVRLPPMDIQ